MSKKDIVWLLMQELAKLMAEKPVDDPSLADPRKALKKAQYWLDAHDAPEQEVP